TCFGLFACAEGQFDMGAMHWIAGLEGDNPAPALSGELLPQFRRRQTQCFEIVAGRPLHTLKPASDVAWIGFVKQVVHPRVTEAGRAEYRLRFLRRSGFHTSSTCNSASITPSASRSAILLRPGVNDFAKSSLT